MIADPGSAANHVTCTSTRSDPRVRTLATCTIGQTVTIDALTLLGDGSETLRLSSDDVLARIRFRRSPDPDRAPAAGLSDTVILDVTVSAGSEIRSPLTRVVAFSPDAAMPPLVTAQTIAPVDTMDPAPIVIGPRRKATAGPSGTGAAERRHRSAINPVCGAPRAPERFATDFARLDDDSRI